MEIPSWLSGNPLYILIAYIIFYFLVAEPLLNLDCINSVILFIVLYVLYKKYGNNYLEKMSNFGKRRRR